MSAVFECLSGQKSGGAFAYSCGDEKVVVSVSIGRGVQGDAWDRLKESPLFADWVARFCPAGRLRLKSVCIQQVLPHFQLGVVAEAADGTALSSVVSLKAPSVGVLLILRNAQTHLELCVFTRKPDLASGLPAALSLLEGSFDEEGLFDGPCAALVEEALGSPIKRSEVLDLQTPLVASEEPSPGMEFAAAPEVLVAPSASKTPPQESALDAAARLGPVRSQLLLCRRTLQPSALAALEAKLGRTRRLGQQATPATPDTAPAALGLSVVYLGDAWRATTDARAVAALFLLVESRYHQVHAKRPSQGAFASGLAAQGVSSAASRREQSRSGGSAHATSPSTAPPTRKVAHFSKVSELTPSSTGINLRVRVFEEVKAEPDRVLPSGRVIKRGFVRVADDSGVVTVSLENSQLEVPGESGSALVIRNGKISMVDGRMRLLVDKWGKIGPAGEEDLREMPDSLCTSHDLSAVEYELVVFAPPNASGAAHSQNAFSEEGSRNQKTRGGSNARRGGRGGRGSSWSKGGRR